MSLSRIERFDADGNLISTGMAEFTCDGGVVCLPRPTTIATDVRPIPTLQAWTTTPEGWTNIPADADAVSEAAFIAGLYAGVPFGEGQRREAEYRRQKAMQEQLQRAAKAGRP